MTYTQHQYRMVMQERRLSYIQKMYILSALDAHLNQTGRPAVEFLIDRFQVDSEREIALNLFRQLCS